MSAIRTSAILFSALLSLSCVLKAHNARLLPPNAERGYRVYQKACASCHGKDGRGKGPAAPGLYPLPRDFTRAVYRYRSTPSGSLPQDTDLLRTVAIGLPGTEMPAWRDHLTSQEMTDVVAYIKRFSGRFGEEEIDKSITVPAPTSGFTTESIARGKEIYKRVQCGKCHGKTGKGDGWAADKEMKDDLGRVIHARDFTKGIYASGRQKEDLYRVFVTGLDGTPMPGYENSLKPRETYDLIHYMLSLERYRGMWYWLSTPPTWHTPNKQKVRR